MEAYLLKSAACLALFFLFYKLFLERENMHVLKRFYLLASLALAFIIPFITFTTYVEIPTEANILVANNGNLDPTVIQYEKQQVFNWTLVLSTLYGLGVLFFSAKFLFNLSQILQKINKNPKHKFNAFINVLLTDSVMPHTFFNYIFLNKQKFETQDIPEEVLLHEQTHAKQKHSVDIVFAELLQIVFWFNPLIYVIKHAMKLNHEFLADQAVLNQGVQTSQYQQILLAFSSSAAQPQLAHSIHYSLIKKRFNIMKTTTSKKAMWIRSFILIPLLAVLVFSFSAKEEVVKHVNQFTDTEPVSDISEATSKHTARSIEIKIFSNGTYSVDGIRATKRSLVSTVNQLHQDITPEIRNNIMNIHVSSPNTISNEEVWFIYNALLDYGFYRLVTKDQEVVRGKGNTPMAVEKLNKTPQQSASRAQMAEYNKLAKHYNTILKKRRDVTIKMKHVERLKYIYNQMSDKQREDAEPFPDFPKPPPMPDAPEAPKFTKDEVMPPPPPVPADATPAQKAKYQKIIDDYNEDSMVPPPPPPPTAPPTMEELAERGAVFYLEGKQITAKKAIEIVNNNKDINIQIIDADSKQPTVKLSKKGITFKASKGMPQADKTDQQNQDETLRTGNTKIYGKDYFYSTKNGVTNYFNSRGESVDQNGKVLANQKRKPTFYFNGKQISSDKANKLLSNNTSIAVTTEDYNDKEYAIVLSDLSKVTIKNPNNINHNPNALIDLTEVISKGATFYYNDVKISTEKAQRLTKDESIERVQIKKGKDGKPKVYFWKKA